MAARKRHTTPRQKAVIAFQVLYAELPVCCLGDNAIKATNAHTFAARWRRCGYTAWMLATDVWNCGRTCSSQPFFRCNRRLDALRVPMKLAVERGTDVSEAVESFDARPFLHLSNAAEQNPGNASRTYLDVERE